MASNVDRTSQVIIACGLTCLMSKDRSRQLYRRLAPSFEAPDMATPGALGQLEGFLANLNLGKYFEVMRDNEVRRHHPRQRRPGPSLSMGAAQR